MRLYDLLQLAEDPPPGAEIMQFVPIMVIGVLFYLLFLRPQMNERRRQTDTVNALKKNDRVVTIGGMIGTIADLSNDGQRVTLKVDDTTRVKFRRSAIQGLYTEESTGDASK